VRRARRSTTSNCAAATRCSSTASGQSLPDPTTAGDFCRRFDEARSSPSKRRSTAARLKVWAAQPAASSNRPAVIDADASIVPTGADQGGNGHLLQRRSGATRRCGLLANTKEPLYLGFWRQPPLPRGVVDYYDRAIALCRRPASHRSACGATPTSPSPPSSTAGTTTGVRFVFGYDAKANLIERAEDVDDELYHELVTRAERADRHHDAHPPGQRQGRRRPGALQGAAPKGRGRRRVLLPPRQVHRDYRVVALRKNISVERGENVLFSEYRYFFYITNDRDMTADEVVDEARPALQPGEPHQPAEIRRARPARPGQHPGRQLGLHDHGRPRLEPESLVRPAAARQTALGRRHNEQRRRLLTMEFRTFRQAFIEIPCQIVTTGRQVRWRILAYNPWLGAFFRLLDTL
jgi:hypothetical protein